MFPRRNDVTFDEYDRLLQDESDELRDDPAAHPGRWERQAARDLGYHWRSGTVSPLGAAAPPPFKETA